MKINGNAEITKLFCMLECVISDYETSILLESDASISASTDANSEAKKNKIVEICEKLMDLISKGISDFLQWFSNEEVEKAIEEVKSSGDIKDGIVIETKLKFIEGNVHNTFFNLPDTLKNGILGDKNNLIYGSVEKWIADNFYGEITKQKVSLETLVSVVKSLNKMILNIKGPIDKCLKATKKDIATYSALKDILGNLNTVRKDITVVIRHMVVQNKKLTITGDDGKSISLNVNDKRTDKKVNKVVGKQERRVTKVLKREGLDESASESNYYKETNDMYNKLGKLILESANCLVGACEAAKKEGVNISGSYSKRMAAICLEASALLEEAEDCNVCGTPVGGDGKVPDEKPAVADPYDPAVNGGDDTSASQVVVDEEDPFDKIDEEALKILTGDKDGGKTVDAPEGTVTESVEFTFDWE